MADKLISELQKIGEYTGLTIENLYKMLEKEAQVYFVYDILGVIVCITLFILGILVTKYSMKKMKTIEEDSYEFDYGFLDMVRAVSSILSLIVFIISLFIVPAMIADMIHIKMNTPGWILQHLSQLIYLK